MSMSQTEQLARERMGLLKEGQSSYQASIQRSRSNPALREVWALFDDAERDILELGSEIKRREYENNPGLAEGEARAKLGLPAINRPGNERPIEDRQVNRGSLQQPTAEDLLRKQLGLRKVRN
jgi:hypothetical protein